MNNQGGLAAFLIGFLVCMLIILAVVIIIQILFLLTLHRTMKEVRERNREVQPGMVWLTLIPLFGMIWIIILVTKIANSLRKEFEDRDWRTDGESFGRTVGLLYAWGGVASVVISIIQNVLQAADMAPVAMIFGLLSLPVSLGILVCWIMYWVQISQYGRRLRERGHRSGSVEADYDDEFRNPRRDEDDFDRRRRDEE
jgi:hypothetical protein